MKRMFHQLECTFHRLERTFHQLEHKITSDENNFISLVYNKLGPMCEGSFSNTLFSPL